ncbi:MAG: hypothetical protein E6767_06825 [Dysgonomonas sp.]|nr:hypothetical protein [Dysgonomonas sp.]
MKTLKYISIVISLLLVIPSCKEDDYGKHTDIDLPIPLIKTITKDPKVGETIVITGENFVTPNTITIDGISMEILSQDANRIEAVLPRLFEAAPVVVRSAYGRYSENADVIKPIYPSAEEIVVTSWPDEITRGRPIAVRGTNMDMVKEVVIGSTKIDVNGLDQESSMLIVLIPTTVSETEATILLKTVIGTTIESAVLPIIDYDPDSWTPIDPLVLVDFEDGVTHYLKGEMPDKQCSAQMNRDGITAPQGNNFFSLYATDITGSYSMWSYLGSIKVEFRKPVNLSIFHDPFISFLWNSDDNIGSFQMAVTQGTRTGGGTFGPGITDDTYDPYTKLDLYTLRPTNGQWHRISARLSHFIVENWGGDFKNFDNNGMMNGFELVFKQINGVYWNGTWFTNADDIYNYNVQGNRDFKVNIDQIMITDGPYDGTP